MTDQLPPSPYLFPSLPVLIIGAGDLASGVAYRLYKAGWPVVMTELAKPTMVRTTVSYGACVQHGAVIVGGLRARCVATDQITSTLAEGVIPVVVDPELNCLASVHPIAVVDARLAKVNLGLHREMAPLVIGLGPGFTAGLDCHSVVETNRGHHCGRVYWQGTAEPDTGVPGVIHGKQSERVLRAPIAGKMTQIKVIGQVAQVDEIIARIGDNPIVAPFTGVLRGLLDDEVYATAGMKIGDLDPRLERHHCFTLSDKSLAIGGGVVEAIFSAPSIRQRLAKF